MSYGKSLADDFIVVSVNPETQERSVDTYEDKDKALEMAKMFKNDFPDRQLYLGSKLERLMEGIQ